MKTPKIIWVNFLHMYQPPWQQAGVVEQVAIKSYDYLLALLEKYRNFKVSLNISGSLLEHLADIRPIFLERLKKLVRQGQVELTGSAKYHALLPLLSSMEINRQINLNQEILKKHFDLKKIQGFYLPEMAWSLPLAKIIKKRGFKWLILDEIHCREKIDPNFLYQIKGINLSVIFRQREISKTYPAEVIFKKLKNQLQTKEIIITATDAEMYGHWHEDWQGHLEQILVDNQNKLVVKTVSQYLQGLKVDRKISLRSASWESTEQELRRGVPFALWQDPKNKLHRKLWRLVYLVSELLYKYKRDKNWPWARWHLDRGLASCTFWWATGKKLSPWSPLAWNPEMIDNGSEELIKVARSLQQAKPREKAQAEKLYIDIKKTTWLNHWLKYNK